MSDPKAQAQSMIDNLPEKTGRSLAEWLALAVPAAHEKHGQLVKWLKSEHGITHGFANLIATETLATRAGGASADDDLVAAQYAGPKAALRPIHDALIDAALAFGADVEVAPKKTYVSLRRRKQFAIVQPSTKARVDLGLNLDRNLDEAATTKRLEPSGSFNAMVSHRVRCGSAADVDAELIGWLRRAYESAG